MANNIYGRAHALRKGRWSAINQIYLVTVCTKNRSLLFSDFKLARVLIKILKDEQDRGNSITLAYVVMPDHLHWLMQLTSGELSQSVQRVKSLLTKRAGIPVWQKGYHDHGLRSEEDMKEIARYIILNPVRAGLVARPGLYPHWDAIWL